MPEGSQESCPDAWSICRRSPCFATIFVMKATNPLRTRAGRIVRELAQLYPDAHCALHYDNPLQLLVATILSAQCTDVRVNLVTPALFARYPDAHAFATADREELERVIQSTGFFRNKAKNIIACCQAARRAARRRGARHDGGAGAAARRRPQDRQRHPRQRLRRARHPRRYARRPAQPAHGPDAAHRPGEDRARPDGADPAARSGRCSAIA